MICFCHDGRGVRTLRACVRAGGHDWVSCGERERFLGRLSFQLQSTYTCALKIRSTCGNTCCRYACCERGFSLKLVARDIPCDVAECLIL